MASIPSTVLSPLGNAVQYIRKITLIASAANGQSVDLSELRIKFSVKQSTAETPNAADIRVYNLSPDTIAFLQKSAKTVILQAGYNSNFGVIFQGNLKQVIVGRESATDTFVELIAGDGDQAYNFAIVNTSLAKGSSQQDQINAAIQQMAKLGVTAGGNSTVKNTQKRPRGKVMFGNARTYLREAAATTKNTWSIQNGQVVYVPIQSYLPGTAVLITDKTGMIGAPEQTDAGVNVKCLLNPFIKINGRIQLDNKTVQLLKVNLTLKPGSATNTAPPLSSNGVYVVIAAEQSGDTRGLEWYTSLVCLTFDPTNGLIASVSNAP